jgi:raffinose/stachyose/melibiose transport system permease protein/N-acetylglucosamine transport system permease protein
MTRRTRWSRTSLLFLVSVPFVYPFLFLVGTAIKTNPQFEEDPTGLPTTASFKNFSEAWEQASLGQAMLNSVLAVSVAVVATLLISAGAAFWFLRHEGRAASVLRWSLIGLMAVPLPVYIIPLFLQLSDRGLTDNLVVMGLIYAGWNSTFGLFLTYSYFKDLPPEVLEAARIDGASLLQQLRYVLIPLSRPVLGTLAVFAFIWSWSDLLAAVVIVQEPEKRLLVPATALLSDVHSNNIPRNTAGLVIALVPMLFVFLLGQRALVRGITSGIGK